MRRKAKYRQNQISCYVTFQEGYGPIFKIKEEKPPPHRMPLLESNHLRTGGCAARLAAVLMFFGPISNL